MNRVLAVACNCLVLLGTASYAQSSSPSMEFRASANVDDWIQKQAIISEQKMFANISPAGAVPGVVIASPSKRDPNYYFHWVRDAGLVMDTVRELYERSSGAERQRYFQALENFTRFSRQNQQTRTTTGLGDPRFNVDGSADFEPWGRPQNDGPALRALTLIRFARSLLSEGKRDYVERELYHGSLPPETVIKADLEYTAHNWRQKDFDPWEEIRGRHFFTRVAQMAALREGAALADELGDGGAADFYRQQASAIERQLEDHWSESRGYYMATVETEAGPDHQKPSELDSSTIIAVLAAEQVGGPAGILNERVLATASALEKMFAQHYAINQDKTVGTAIGRYQEDYYFGGNPWPLTTAAFAELHYRVAKLLQTSSRLPVTNRNLEFFVSALPEAERGLIKVGQDLAADANLKKKVASALRTKGDGFMRRIQRHANPDGSLSEQMHRDSGYMISARDLTWSYASFIDASIRR